MLKKIFSLLFFLFFIICSPVYAINPATVWEAAALGVQPAITQVNLYGFNGGITTTFEAAWPESAAYAPLTVAMSTPYCASSSASDASAGTGARTIRVTGINTSFASFSEIVTMNGLSSVNLVTSNVLLINSMEVKTAGSGGLNAGIIQCGTGVNTSGDPAVTHSYMPAGSLTATSGAANAALSFIYGVPAGKSLLCRNITAGSVFATAASSLQVAIDCYTNLGLVKRFFEQHIHTTGANPFVFSGLIEFPEKTIIVGKLAGPTGTSTGPADLRAECLLIDNGYLALPESIF